MNALFAAAADVLAFFVERGCDRPLLTSKHRPCGLGGRDDHGSHRRHALDRDAHHAPAPLLRRPGLLSRRARALLLQPLDLRRPRRSDSERRRLLHAHARRRERHRHARRAPARFTRCSTSAVIAARGCASRPKVISSIAFSARITTGPTTSKDGCSRRRTCRPDFSKDDYPLHRAGCEVWDGNVFVHLGRRHGQDGRDGPDGPTDAHATCASSSRICPIASPPGRWPTCASAGASSTTSRRTGS